VYVLDAFDLASRDEKSLSDPYVIIKLGDKTVGDPKAYQTDKTNCGFFDIYELETTLPGTSLLKIQVWDHDDCFSDDLIGTTKIDLEDRFFSNKWSKLVDKPIETRTLYHKSTKVEQGTIRLWVDVIPKVDKSTSKPWSITPRPPSKFEARLIVWQTEDVTTFDVEGTSDIYIRAWVNTEEP
jgi:Ca2+-dependent lipid-binding protein